MQGPTVRKLRVCDIVAESFEKDAAQLPPSMKDDAERLRKQAADWRERCVPPYDKIATEVDFRNNQN